MYGCMFPAPGAVFENIENRQFLDHFHDVLNFPFWEICDLPSKVMCEHSTEVWSPTLSGTWAPRLTSRRTRCACGSDSSFDFSESDLFLHLTFDI